MADYDPGILQKFANKLYAHARGIVAVWTLLGVIAGVALGLVAVAVLELEPLMPLAVGGGLVGLLGLAIGNSRAFMLRLQAQTALCQRQIELNTRAGG